MSYRVLSLIILCSLFCATAQSARPNFVFILVDDLGRQDLSYEGSTFYETPNIDQIARRAMRFTNGYAACQVCSPSRAAIQTGKSPARLHITDYIGAPHSDKWTRNTQLLPAPYEMQLDLDEITIAEALGASGYKTFFAGKWHLGGDGFLPTDQGYQINQGGHAAGTPPGGFFSPYKNPKLTDGPDGEQLPLRLGQETANFIRQVKAEGNGPFFAMLSFYSVHAPIQTTEALWKKYRDKAQSLGLTSPRQRFIFDRTQEVRQVQDNPLYAGMMESMDTAVGMVLDAIKETANEENTVIIFTSDNGGVSSGDGYATSCLPFRGGKGRQWEGGIREPFYIVWPGITKGTENPTPVIHTDFYPTILQIAGIKTENPTTVDGLSLVDVLKGGELEKRSLYWHYPHYGNQGGEPSAIIRDGNYKLIHYFEDDRNELYNLDLDIGEQHDLAKQQPEKVQSMFSKLSDWQKSVGAKMPTRNPKYDDAAHQQQLQRLQQVGMLNREKEHARFLEVGFVPLGGWWQFKKENAQQK